MMEHLDDTTIHDLLDGELSAEEAATAREHLDGCLPCARRFRSLRGTVEALRELPVEAAAPEGMWDAIRRRTVETNHVPDEGRRSSPSSIASSPPAGGARRRFSLVELATAAALVGLLSAGTVWMAMAPSGSGVEAGPPAATASARPLVPAGAAARAAATGAEEYADVVQELERLVEAGRGVLEPNTVRTLEEATASVDRALADIHGALAEDPGSALLERLLVTQQTRKLRILQRAVTAIESRT